MSSLSNDDTIVAHGAAITALQARVAANQGATDDTNAGTVALALDALIAKLIAADLMAAGE